MDKVIDGHIPVSHYQNLYEARRLHSYKTGTANFHEFKALVAMETEWKTQNPTKSLLLI